MSASYIALCVYRPHQIDERGDAVQNRISRPSARVITRCK